MSNSQPFVDPPTTLVSLQISNTTPGQQLSEMTPTNQANVTHATLEQATATEVILRLANLEAQLQTLHVRLVALHRELTRFATLVVRLSFESAEAESRFCLQRRLDRKREARRLRKRKGLR